MTTPAYGRIYAPMLLPAGVVAHPFRTPAGGGASSPTAAGADYAPLSASYKVSAVASGGVRITFTPPDSMTSADGALLYVVLGGKVQYATQGGPTSLPITEPSLIITVSPALLNSAETRFPWGVPRPTTWVYSGFDDTTFRQLVSEWSLLVPPDEMARTKATLGVSASVPNDAAWWVDQVLAGKWAPRIVSGTVLGVAGAADGGAYAVQLRGFDAGGKEIASISNTIGSLGSVDAALEEHPVVVAAAAIPAATEIYLRLRYFDPTPTTQAPTGHYVWLEGASVALMNSRSLSSSSIATAVSATGANAGRAQFLVPAPGLAASAFHFEVTPAQPLPTGRYVDPSDTSQDPMWTGTWSTRARNDASGQPLWVENFRGASLGRPDNPLVVTVGLPVVVRITHDIPFRAPLAMPASTGVLLNFRLKPALTSDLPELFCTFRADATGLVVGSCLEVPGTVASRVELAPTIVPSGGWPTRIDLGFDWDVHPPIMGSYVPADGSLGEPDRPRDWRIFTEDGSWPFALLMVLQLCTAARIIDAISAGAVRGPDPVQLNIAKEGFSLWPDATNAFTKSIKLTVNSMAALELAGGAHEFSHVVAMRLMGLPITYVSSWSLLAHELSRVKNDVGALLEGWADLIAVLAGAVMPTFTNSPPLPPGARTAIGAASPNATVFLGANGAQPISVHSSPLLGRSVEGIFVAALAEFLEARGIAPVPGPRQTSLNIPLPWRDDQTLLELTKAIVWSPLVAAIATAGVTHSPTTTDYLNALSEQLPTADWDDLRVNYLVPYNLWPS